jgi:hypothetical protein
MRTIVLLAVLLGMPATTIAQSAAPATHSARLDGSIPIYPNSTLATMGGPGENDPRMAAALKAGTSATFVTGDSEPTVAAWYRKNLPGSYAMKSSAGTAQFTSGGNQVNVYAHQTTTYRTRIVILPQ